MKNNMFYKVGKWADRKVGKLLRKNHLIREAEQYWEMKLSYYVDKLGEDYPEATNAGTAKESENMRKEWVHLEKCEIIGGFIMGFLCSSLWACGDLLNKIGEIEGSAQMTIQISIYIGVVLAAGAGIAFVLQNKLSRRVRKRQENIKSELPGFITNMILLLQAGVTIMRAFNMSVQAIDKDSPLKRAGLKVEKDLLRGIREEEALEKFADRCRIIEASRLVSVMIQNLRKGGNEISPMLRVVANECWEERKKIARVKGEEASAKLLLPMMMLLVAIVCIVVTPAILTLTEV